MSIKSICLQYRKLNFYARAVVGVVPISLILLAYLLGFHFSELFVSEWFFDLLPPFAFVGSLLSGSTYFARALEIDQAFEKKKTRAINREYAGTAAGVVIGLAVGVALLLKLSVPFASSLCGLANAVFLVNQIGMFGGVGSRLGSCANHKSPRPVSERYAIGMTALISVAVAAVIFAFSAAALVSVVGVTTFFTSGAALPLWIVGALFVTSFASTMISAVDYTSKAVNHLRSKNTSEKKHEYQGSFFGVSAGVCLGVAVIVGLAIAQPHIFLGVLGVAAAVAIIATSVSIIGGLCSRIGRFLDVVKYSKKPIENHPEETPKKNQIKKPSIELTSSFIRKRLNLENQPYIAEIQSNPAQLPRQQTKLFRSKQELLASNFSTEPLNYSLGLC